MAGLFSEDDKREIKQSFRLLHDTFGREIEILRDAKKIVVSTNSTFNSVYGMANNGATSVEYSPVKSGIKARIAYANQQNETNLPGTSIGAELSEGEVKITVTIEDYNNFEYEDEENDEEINNCLLYTSPSPRDQRGSRVAGCG